MSTRQFYELVKKCRTIRRFDEAGKVDRDTLLDLIELARLSPSGANMQPLRYVIVNDGERCNAITGLLGWAGALKDWDRPEEGQRPTAYIIIGSDSRITKTPQTDSGIAAHAILLGAAERGLGGCMFGSIQKEKLRKLLDIDRQYEIVLAVALGLPAETVVIDQISIGMDERYYRDDNDTHHVPKIALNDLLLKS